MTEAINTYEYSVVPENIDFRGHITIPALCGYIINAVGRNIRAEGYGVDVLARENRSWVLVRSAIEIDARPGLYAPISVSVWPVSKGGITYYRCLRLLEADGTEVGRATTEWCMLDIASRRPVTPETDFQNCGRHYGLPCDSPRRIRDFAPQVTDERRVGYSECDFNGHLNNTRYIEMFYDLLPEEMIETCSRIRIDMNYRKEVGRGARLSLGLKRQDRDEYLFMARSGDQTLCSASVTST